MENETTEASEPIASEPIPPAVLNPIVFLTGRLCDVEATNYAAELLVRLFHGESLTPAEFDSLDNLDQDNRMAAGIKAQVLLISSLSARVDSLEAKLAGIKS
jgi:hypothetical protein